MDVRNVGEQLGARYVIEGSIRKAGDRVRVSAQLINSETGHHIWAERYDRNVADLFELQDEIAQRIAGIVTPELERSESKRQAKKQPKDLEAWDCCIRGRSLLAAFDPKENKRARELFERAIELEPESSQAYAGLARSHYRDILLGGSRDHNESAAKALEAARQAVELDRMDSLAHMLLAIAHQFAGEHAPSLAEAEIAVRLNPSNAHAHFTLGLVLSQVGRPADGIRVIDQGFRLNPYEPGNHFYFCMMSHAHFTSRDIDAAIEWARKAEQIKPEAREPHIFLAAALGILGRVDDAQYELAAGEPLEPLLKTIGGLFDWQHDADKQHFLDGLRKAGWEG